MVHVFLSYWPASTTIIMLSGKIWTDNSGLMWMRMRMYRGKPIETIYLYDYFKKLLNSFLLIIIDFTINVLVHTDIQVCEGWGCGWRGRGCECGSVFKTASIWCLTQAICSHTSTRWHYNVRTKHQTIFELFTMTFMYFYNVLSPGPVWSLGRGQIQPLNLWPQPA